MNQCTVSHIPLASLRSKWAAGKARGGRISKAIRNRRATQPPAHFQRNPLGRGRLAVFPRCSLLTYRFRYARRSRLEKQPTDLRRNQRYLGDGTLVSCPRDKLISGTGHMIARQSSPPPGIGSESGWSKCP